MCRLYQETVSLFILIFSTNVSNDLLADRKTDNNERISNTISNQAASICKEIIQNCACITHLRFGLAMKRIALAFGLKTLT